MFSYVRLSDGGPRRHEGPRSEIEVIASIAERVLPTTEPINWHSMHGGETIRQAIAKIVPGLERVENIGKSKQEFQIPGRTFHTPTFPTPNGRAKIHSHDSIPEILGSAPGEENLLRMMTIRSEGQFNTVVYEDYDLYRNVKKRDVILMNPADVKRLVLEHNQRVTIRNETGRIDGFTVWEFEEIKAGNTAMYCPEANELVPPA